MIYRYADVEDRVQRGRLDRRTADVMHAYARWLRGRGKRGGPDLDEDAIAELAAAEHADPGGWP